jgi:hypothetical protein
VAAVWRRAAGVQAVGAEHGGGGWAVRRIRLRDGDKWPHDGRVAGSCTTGAFFELHDMNLVTLKMDETDRGPSSASLIIKHR